MGARGSRTSLWMTPPNRRLFFFSSRRRHTRLQGDWSSDVCSSDLEVRHVTAVRLPERLPPEAVVADVDEAVAIDVPEHSRALAYTPGAPLDGCWGLQDRKSVV